MITLTVEEVVLLHKKVIALTGGSSSVRDLGLLESAVLGCYQSFSGQEIYPTVIEKAAGLACAICNNHAFVDGNKRVAVLSMLVFLRANDINLAYAQNELVSLGQKIATGTTKHSDVVAWISAHTDFTS